MAGNLLNGTLPASLGTLTPTPSTCGLWLANNLFSGAFCDDACPLPRTWRKRLQEARHALLPPLIPPSSAPGTIPSAMAALSSAAVAYLPLVVGPMPAGLTVAVYYPSVRTRRARPGGRTHARRSGPSIASGASSLRTLPFNPTHKAAKAVVVLQPLTAGACCLLQAGGGFYYRGSSIGLDRPMGAILGDIADALDLSRQTLFDWTGLQPCAPTLSGQARPSATSGGGWLGVTCGDDTTNKEGGVTAISLASLGLTGSLAGAFRELRTLRTASVQNNLLQGTIPQARRALRSSSSPPRRRPCPRPACRFP